MNKTLKNLVKANDDELSFGGYTVDMLEEFAKTHIKYLKRQIKLHWQYVSSSLGENPACKIPRGFKNEYSIQGKEEIIKWIQKTFNLEMKK